jgi:hypothetical protein
VVIHSAGETEIHDHSFCSALKRVPRELSVHFLLCCCIVVGVPSICEENRQIVDHLFLLLP